MEEKRFSHWGGKLKSESIERIKCQVVSKALVITTFFQHLASVNLKNKNIKIEP